MKRQKKKEYSSISEEFFELASEGRMCSWHVKNGGNKNNESL